MKKPWYIGIVKGRIMPRTPGVADYDGTAETYGRDPLPKAGGIQYGMGETFILVSIKAIRDKYPHSYDRLEQFRQLKQMAEQAHLSGRDKDAIADIDLAIAEIETRP